ncbi:MULTISPECIES: DUF5313 family protein [unclassified Blastococcus]
MRTRHPAPPVPRPNALQWLRYALGGGLPERFAPWVLADTTRPGWVRRHVARAVVQMLPLMALCLAVPVPVSYRVSAALGGLLIGLSFSLAFMVETTEHRVAKAGYPAGTAAAVREERAERERVERRSPYRVDGAGSYD